MPLNLTLKPAQTELVAKPGSTITQVYEITNNSNENVTLSSSVAPWSPKGNDGSIEYGHTLANPNLSFSLGNADLILGQTFTIAPGQKRQLVLKIKSDSSIPESDAYYTFFVSQNLGFSPSSSSQTASFGRIGSHLLISYSSAENPGSKFSLSQFKVTPTIKDIFFPSLKFTATASNNSTYYAKVSGKITISKNNLVVKELDLFPSNVLAASSREITCLQNSSSVPCTLSPPFWPGAYTATITLDPTLHASSISTTFFVFPYALSFFICVTIITILSFVQRLRLVLDKPNNKS